VTKTYIIVALVSYLLGSIPFGYILVKLFLKQDIRATGSGNIGATNVARSGAKGLAIATLVLDALKGLLAVHLAKIVFWPILAKSVLYCGEWSDFVCAWPTSYATAVYLGPTLAALAAILGHMFPVWLRFKGGKGVATGVGAFVVLAPHSLAISFLLFLAAVGTTRLVSLGSMLAATSFPFFVWLLNTKMANLNQATPRSSLVPPAPVYALIVACSLLIILKHHENIRRLLAGTETKFGGKKSVPPPEAMEKQA
jgi:glycerol-3-phosphate acyltransferase PlsY